MMFYYNFFLSQRNVVVVLLSFPTENGDPKKFKFPPSWGLQQKWLKKTNIINQTNGNKGRYFRERDCVNC
jgi:hypothetical protein